jgi:hypothetical protein
VDGDEIHFHPLMGCHLQAHRFNKPSNDDFFVELDLPVLHSSECDSELACLENTFKGIQPISWRKTEANDLLVRNFSQAFLSFVSRGSTKMLSLCRQLQIIVCVGGIDF